MHLEQVFVHNGEHVEQGQPIGLEGWTGLAAHRHLHWSVNKVAGHGPKEWNANIHKDWDGISVPFVFAAMRHGKRVRLNSAKLQCAHANIGMAPPAEQPVLRGVLVARSTKPRPVKQTPPAATSK